MVRDGTSWTEFGGEEQREGAALAGGAGDGEFAAHLDRELVGDGEAEARAADSGEWRLIDLVEGLEDALEVFRVHADAGVGDVEADAGLCGRVAGVADADGDRAVRA